MRAACLGRLTAGSIGNAAVLALYAVLFLPLALAGMRRRLIK